jgi:hypothetical protein
MFNLAIDSKPLRKYFSDGELRYICNIAGGCRHRASEAARGAPAGTDRPSDAGIFGRSVRRRQAALGGDARSVTGQRWTRDLAMFNLAIDSKLRGCDVVTLKVEDAAPSGYAVDRATVRQKKTGQPVRFELTEQSRQAVDD